MKDSGIEWIGNVPDNWSFIRGKYIFAERNERGNKNTLQLLSPTQKYGVIPQSLYEELSGMKAVKLDEKTDFNAMKSIYIGDFCISLRSFQGGFEYSEYDGVVSPAYHVFYKTTALCDSYYKYLFKTQAFIEKMASLTKTFRDGKSIAFNDFADSFIPVPPLSEQQAISAQLNDKCSYLENIIEKTRVSIEEYKALKQAIITHAVTKGVCGNRVFKNSGIEWIGYIPQDWSCSNLGKFCFVTKLAGFEFTKDMVNNITEQGEVPIVRAQNIKMGIFIDSINEFISYDLSLKLNRCSLDRKCILMTFIGAGIGEVAIFDKEKRYHLAPNVAKIVINCEYRQALSEEYLLYYLMSYPGQEEVNKIKKATAQPSLSMETIRSIKILLPSLEEQKKISLYLNEKCKEIDRLISKKEVLLNELTLFKKSMIYEYVTGKKEVTS